MPGRRGTSYASCGQLSLPIDGQSEEYVAGHAAGASVAGVDQYQPAGNRWPWTVERSAARRDLVDGLVGADAVEIPDHFTVGRRVRAQVSIDRSREHDTGNRAHGRGLRRAAPFAVAASGRRRVPDALAGLELERKQTAALSGIGIRTQAVRNIGADDVRQGDVDVVAVGGGAPL